MNRKDIFGGVFSCDFGVFVLVSSFFVLLGFRYLSASSPLTDIKSSFLCLFPFNFTINVELALIGSLVFKIFSYASGDKFIPFFANL